MWENVQLKRYIERKLPQSSEHALVLLTGARQSGKTTCLRKFYPELAYYNLDAIEYREQLSAISSFQWASEVGDAVLDEIQKEPSLFDKIKFAFDEGGLNFSVLSGSAQILLLKKIRETFAGRIQIRELFPLLLSELIHAGKDHINEPIIAELTGVQNIAEILSEKNPVLLGENWDLSIKAENYLIQWGGMPPLLHIKKEEDKKNWLKDYAVAYLERDLRDLTNLNDLKPFSRFQKLSALRAASLLSYSELSRDSGIAVETARRYLEYLRISYQAFLIQPYHKNLTSQLVKTPKLFWFDNGILRTLSGMGFEIQTGQLFENYVASEIMKLLRTSKSDAELSFYRTRSGMEVDFCIESPNGFMAMEVKNRNKFSASDFSLLKRLAVSSGTSWSGGILIYRGNKIECFDKKLNLWAISSCRLFGK